MCDFLPIRIWVLLCSASHLNECLLFLQVLLCQRVPHCLDGEIINHTYFSLSYLESFEQAEWVHYKHPD